MWKLKLQIKTHRVKQLFCYDFMPKEEIMANPLKTLFFTDCLGMYDWAMANKFFLSTGVSVHSGLSQCMV